MGRVFQMLLSGLGIMIGQAATSATFAIALAVAVFVGLDLLGMDLGKWIFEQLLSLFSYILNMFDLDFTFLNFMDYAHQLPPDLLNVMAFLGFENCISMVIKALMIRIMLNLIPFIKL